MHEGFIIKVGSGPTRAGLSLSPLTCLFSYQSFQLAFQ